MADKPSVQAIVGAVFLGTAAGIIVSAFLEALEFEKYASGWIGGVVMMIVTAEILERMRWTS